MQKEETLTLTELTLNDLSLEGDIDEADFLDRVDCLCSLGQNVMISNYQEHYKLASYLSQFTRKRKLAIILGFNNLVRIFDESYYHNLDGGILESFSRLFGSNVQLYVYPTLNQNDQVLTIKDFEPEPHLEHLFKYLVANDKVKNVSNAKSSKLHIISDKVVEKIRNNESGWEEDVPQKVVELIKEHHMFDFPYEVPQDEEEDYLEVD